MVSYFKKDCECNVLYYFDTFKTFEPIGYQTNAIKI